MNREQLLGENVLTYLDSSDLVARWTVVSSDLEPQGSDQGPKITFYKTC